MNHEHFSGQVRDRRHDTWEDKLARAERSAAKFRAMYRDLKRFLLGKGVPQSYFDEYNARFSEEYEKDKTV